MEKRSYEGMTIRVPSPFAKELQKLKEQDDLPSIGSALQIYIENLKIQRLESRLNSIEEQINKLTKIAKEHTGLIVGIDNLMNRILNLFSKANQRFEALEKVK